MSVLKGVALVVVSFALQSAPPVALAATADCVGDGSQPRLIGLDRTETDVCADRFALAPEPPLIPMPSASASPTRAVVPLEEISDGTCARFVPALALTVPVACRNGEATKPEK